MTIHDTWNGIINNLKQIQSQNFGFDVLAFCLINNIILITLVEFSS